MDGWLTGLARLFIVQRSPWLSSPLSFATRRPSFAGAGVPKPGPSMSAALVKTVASFIGSLADAYASAYNVRYPISILTALRVLSMPVEINGIVSNAIPI